MEVNLTTGRPTFTIDCKSTLGDQSSWRCPPWSSLNPSAVNPTIVFLLVPLNCRLSTWSDQNLKGTMGKSNLCHLFKVENLNTRGSINYSYQREIKIIMTIRKPTNEQIKQLIIYLTSAIQERDKKFHSLLFSDRKWTLILTHPENWKAIRIYIFFSPHL